MAASNLLSDELLCSICLDIFTDPVTIPCGHNFCKSCVTVYWANSLFPTCALCKKEFDLEVNLNVNTTLRAIADQLNPERDGDPDSRPADSRPATATSGNVSCDACVGTREPALKSCAVCLLSYCQEHLGTHRASFANHQLIDPEPDLMNRMCRNHQQPLTLFCRRHQTMVCVLCLEHRNHNVLPLEKASMQKKVEVRRAEDKVQQLIEGTLTEVRQSQCLGERLRVNTLREIDHVRGLFATVGHQSARALQERFRADSEKALWDVERAALRRKRELQEELSRLRCKATELQQLSQSSDPFHVLQTFPTLTGIPGSSVRRSRGCSTLWARSYDYVVSELGRLAREKREHTVSLTLDPSTAHPCLLLSQDGTHLVSCPGRTCAATKRRFTRVQCALASQGFTTETVYWEVEVERHSAWCLGVAEDFFPGAALQELTPEKGFWVLWWQGEGLVASSDGRFPRPVCSPPRRVGLYLNCFLRELSVFDVLAQTLLHTFSNVHGVGKLFPLFSPSLYPSECSHRPSLTLLPVR